MTINKGDTFKGKFTNFTWNVDNVGKNSIRMVGLTHAGVVTMRFSHAEIEKQFVRV